MATSQGCASHARLQWWRPFRPGTHSRPAVTPPRYLERRTGEVCHAACTATPSIEDRPHLRGGVADAATTELRQLGLHRGCKPHPISVPWAFRGAAQQCWCAVASHGRVCAGPALGHAREEPRGLMVWAVVPRACDEPAEIQRPLTGPAVPCLDAALSSQPRSTC